MNQHSSGVFAEAVHVNGVAVVLRGDVAAVSFQVQRRLVLAAVPKLQFVSVSALRQRKYLSAQADAHHRNFFNEFSARFRWF